MDRPALFLPSLLVATLACVAAGAAEPSDPGVREVAPQLYYLEDEQGRLVPVPGFGYRDFMEFFRLREGLAGPALPPAAVLERLTVRIDARQAGGDGGDRTCPTEVECVVGQSRGGWAAVPLALDGLLLTAAPKHDGPGRMVVDADPAGGYRCWLEAPLEAGAEATHTVTLSGRTPAAGDSFDLRLPTAVASLVELATDREAPEVTIRPDRAGRVETVAGPEGATVKVTGLSGHVRLGLVAAAEAAPSAVAAEAECDGTVRIDGRSAVIDAVLEIRGLPPGRDRVRIGLPPRTVLRGLRGGSVADGGGPPERPFVDVAIERSAAGEARLELTCERPVDPTGREPLEPLGFAVEGIESWRQWGRTTLVIDGEWQAAWNDSGGLRRIDPPAGERPPGFVATFAYDAQPASLPLRILPRRSRVVIEPEYRYHVSATRITLDMRLRVAARGAPVATLSVAVDPAWAVDDVGPAGIVDQPAVIVERGQVTIPLLQPLSGDAVIELRATRAIDRDAERIEWTLPAPRADLVGPAEVVVGSDADIEVMPDNERIVGLVRRTATGLSATAADETALAYRLDAAAGEFAAARRFLPQRVQASAVARIAVDERELAVDETLRLEVLHVPLEFVELVVPVAVLESGTLEVRQGTALLDTVEMPADPSAEPTTPTMRALLTVPLLGEGEFHVTYRLPTPPLPAEATTAVDLPLVAPVGGAGGPRTALIEEPPTLAVGVRGEAWRRESAVAAGGPRTWIAAQPQATLPLSIAARPAEADAATIVEATWLQTRLFAGRREDIATFVVGGGDGPLEIALPGSGPFQGDVRVDGRASPGGIRDDGTIVVERAAEADRPVIVEVRSQADWGGTAAGLGLPWPLELAAPRFAGDTRQRRFYWEIIAPVDDHLLGAPTGWTSQQAWRWTGFGWDLEPAVGSEELAEWIVAAAGGAQAARNLVAAGPTPAARRFVYVGVGPPGGGPAWLIPNWTLVLVCSGLALAAGLAAVYRPGFRRPAIVVPSAALAVLASIAFPAAAPLAAQAAAPGCGLAAVAAVLRWLVERRNEPAPRAAIAQSASSLTRTAPPTISLIVGPSVAEEGTATAGRDAS